MSHRGSMRASMGAGKCENLFNFLLDFTYFNMIWECNNWSGEKYLDAQQALIMYDEILIRKGKKMHEHCSTSLLLLF